MIYKNFIFYLSLLCYTDSKQTVPPDKTGRPKKGYLMTIRESAENYLETILMLSERLPVVRSVDIATELNFKKPSISVAMKNLRENGYITVTKEGYIYLNDSGREIAETIYERHKLLSSWLIALGVNEKTATEDACRIEHDISPESFEAIKRHIHSA